MINILFVQLSRLAQQKHMKSHLIYPEITQIPRPIEASAIQVHQLDYEDNSIAGLLRLIKFIRAHKIKVHLLLRQTLFEPEIPSAQMLRGAHNNCT